MFKCYRILLLFILLLFPYLGAAQSFYFKQISIKEGISQSTVQSILCDNQQILWLGTKNGLNRYDGYELKKYFNVSGDSTSLPGNNIFFILEDAQKEIWMGTQNGICRYDAEKNKFKVPLVNGEPIYSCCYSLRKEGVVFVGNGAIYQYSYATGEITKNLIVGEARKEYFTLCRKWDEETLLIAGRFSKPYLLDIKTGKMQPFAKNDIRNITALFVESKQRIWIAQYNKGVYCMNEKGEIVKRYTTRNSKLGSNIVLSFLVRQQQLWMATDGGGINILDRNTGEFSLIEHVPGESNTLPVNAITCLYKDEEDNVWAGSVRGGVFGIRSVNMKTYSDVPLGDSNGLSDMSVISLLEDDGNLLWVGTDGGGINRFDPIRNRFTHYPDTYKEKVSSIYKLNEEELLLSIFGKGLYRFNKKNGKRRPLPVIDERTTDSIYSVGVSIIIHPGKNNEVYLLGVGTFLLDTHTLKFQSIASPSPVFWAQPFYHSKKYSYLWSHKAIYRLDHREHSFEKVWTLKDERKVSCACHDGKHTLYIGTTAGLLSYDMKTKKNKILSDFYLTSILYERPDRIWIGAQNKLFAYNPVKERFAVFGNSDGVSPNELLARPVCATLGDDIYMGGSMGLLRINKKNLSQDSLAPQLLLSRMEQDGTPLEIKNSQMSEITIPWNFRNVQFYFNVKEKNFFREKTFRYTISGDGSSVVESGKPVLSLYSLPAGKYAISAQCDMQNGEWTPPAAYVLLTVLPPWWKSTGAILAYVLLGIAGAWIAILYYIRKSKRRLREEMEIHERKVNEEKIQFLININHELRTPLTLIYAPLKRLIDSHEPLSENTQLRSIFRQAQRMKNIINMVLDVRKMEVGKEQLNFSVCKLNEWITMLSNDFRGEFESKDIQLEVELDKRIRQFIVDQEKLEKAFTNILMNALKFSNPPSCVKVITLRIENGVRISVTDQGIGLGKHPEKLFQRFYQGEHDRGGTGIGLSYSKLLIEIQGGTIRAFNNPDVGATFAIELPKRMKSKKTVCASKPYINELLSGETVKEAGAEDFSLQQYSLLIVEDESDLRSFLKDCFKDKFNKVYVAENGESGFQQVINSHPDIVVSDVMMPVMDGYELCRCIKNDLRCSHIPVILLTARGDLPSLVTGYKTGADAYLPKPFDDEVLISLIQTQMKNREYIKKKYKNGQGSALASQEITFSNADEMFIEKFNDLIANHMDSGDLDVEFLAREMGMSRSSLYNKINLLLDISIGDYINKQRMSAAEHLVIHTDMSFQEIAERTGFSTQRYFSKVFKDIYGIPPSKYRESNHS